MKTLKRNDINKCFDKINENVGVNRAPVRNCPSSLTGDLGRDTFEKENLIKWKIKELNGRPRGFGLDPPTGSGRSRGSPHVKLSTSVFIRVGTEEETRGQDNPHQQSKATHH